MSSRVIGLFTAAEDAELAHLLVGVLVEYLAAGHRVRVVDADPAQGHISRLLRNMDWRGTDFISLLRNPELEPRAVDITDLIAVSRTPRSSLDILPVLPRGAPLDPTLVQAPPLHGLRRFESLRHRLSQGGPTPDLVFVLAPAGSGPLVVQLLAHAVHAAVFVAIGKTSHVAQMSQLSLNAEALRGSVIPSLGLDVRDGHELDLGEAWRSFWRRDRRHLAPGQGQEDDPVPVLVLDDNDHCMPEWALTMRRMVHVHEPDAEERLREAEAEGWPEVAEEAFAAVRAQDRAHAQALFDAEIAPRLGTLTSALAATRAVWAALDSDLEEKRHYASVTIQKFRFEAPNEQAQFMVRCFEELCAAAEADAGTRAPARLFINLAEALLHTARWQRVSGLDWGDAPDRAEALLLRASKMPRRPEDRARSAMAWARHGRLVGSVSHYDDAIEDLRGLDKAFSLVRMQRKVTDVVGYFARVQPALWQIVVDIGQKMVETDRAYAHWVLAVAYCHIGRRRDALTELWRLGEADLDAYHMAWSDPDLAPLWEGVGTPDYSYDPPAARKSMR